MLPRFGYVTLRVITPLFISKKAVRGKKGFPRYFQPYDAKDDRFVTLSVEDFIDQYSGNRPGRSRKHSARASKHRFIQSRPVRTAVLPERLLEHERSGNDGCLARENDSSFAPDWAR